MQQVIQQVAGHGGVGRRHIAEGRNEHGVEQDVHARRQHGAQGDELGFLIVILHRGGQGIQKRVVHGQHDGHGHVAAVAVFGAAGNEDDLRRDQCQGHGPDGHKHHIRRGRPANGRILLGLHLFKEPGRPGGVHGIGDDLEDHAHVIGKAVKPGLGAADDGLDHDAVKLVQQQLAQAVGHRGQADGHAVAPVFPADAGAVLPPQAEHHIDAHQHRRDQGAQDAAQVSLAPAEGQDQQHGAADAGHGIHQAQYQVLLILIVH